MLVLTVLLAGLAAFGVALPLPRPCGAIDRRADDVNFHGGVSAVGSTNFISADLCINDESGESIGVDVDV